MNGPMPGKNLAPDASIPEKLQGLIDGGMDMDSLSEVFGVGDHTVKSWRLGAIPTQRSIDTLDGMTEAMRVLLTDGMEPSEAAGQILDLHTEDEPADDAPEPVEADGDEETAPMPAGFEDDASPRERVAALVEAGFRRKAIAQAVGVGSDTITRWLAQDVRLQSRTHERLDNLRVAMKMLIEAGLDAETAAIWMRSPLNSNLDNIPVHEIAREPDVVLRGIDTLFIQPVKR